jgi:alkylation response protein AidB-like acyl-CoA dehydrogenase
MHEARLFRMYIPKALGGLEIDPITSMIVVEEIARADAAAAWNLMLGATYGLWAAFLPDDAACEIYGAPDAVVAGALRPTGRARPVDGGFVVDGRWSFASGIRHAAWWNAGCLVGRDGAGDADTPAPEAWLVFFPAPDGELIDNWDVGGLRGTGSHDYAVCGLFVPRARAIPFDAAPRAPGPLYRLPRQALLDNTMAALPLGIARTAIDTLVEIAAGRKRPAGAGAPLAERATVQADVARAEALYLSGRALLYDSLAQSWEAAQDGRELSVREIAVLRLARTHAVQAAVQAVDLMYTDAGGAAILHAQPARTLLPRHPYRDAARLDEPGQLRSQRPRAARPCPGPRAVPAIAPSAGVGDREEYSRLPCYKRPPCPADRRRARDLASSRATVGHPQTRGASWRGSNDRFGAT